jgi:hypothetical protein
MPELTKEEWLALANCVSSGEIAFKKPLNELVKEMQVLDKENEMPRLQCCFTTAGKFLMDNFKPEWTE